MKHEKKLSTLIVESLETKINNQNRHGINLLYQVGYVHTTLIDVLNKIYLFITVNAWAEVHAKITIKR
jgi:hypothetical protein